MSKKIDITGERYGRLTVLKLEPSKKYLSMWRCRCDCGNEITAYLGNLRRGTTQSCGCLQRERTSKANILHGDTDSSLYRRYKHILYRCYNPKCKDYSNYGGRGIKICNEWLDNYKAFREWSLQNGYKEELTIDRKDVNGDYEPNNCRWITLEEQQSRWKPYNYLFIQTD